MCSLGRDILNGNCALQMREIWGLGSGSWRGGVVLEALFNGLDKQPSVSSLSRRPTTLSGFPKQSCWLSEPAPVYSITYRNNKPGVWRVGQSTLHHCTTGHASMTWGACFWICLWIHVTPNCTKTPFKYSPGSPFHISKCTPDLKL